MPRYSIEVGTKFFDININDIFFSGSCLARNLIGSGGLRYIFFASKSVRTCVGRFLILAIESRVTNFFFNFIDKSYFISVS